MHVIVKNWWRFKLGSEDEDLQELKDTQEGNSIEEREEENQVSFNPYTRKLFLSRIPVTLWFSFPSSSIVEERTRGRVEDGCLRQLSQSLLFCPTYY